jgi:hypothetical protein
LHYRREKPVASIGGVACVMIVSKGKAIFGRVFVNGEKAMTPELARHILGLGFNDKNNARMHSLTVKNRENRISQIECEELDSYIKVGDLLAILQSKARKFLKSRPL